MKLEVEIELAMNQHQAKCLWGILHHHLSVSDLDASEMAFVSEAVKLLDPDKTYENDYMARR